MGPAAVARRMARRGSGLYRCDRTWLKITIRDAFLGSDLVDWLHANVNGFHDRKEARKFAARLLKEGYVRHTVNKITFSDQCYYVLATETTTDAMHGLTLSDPPANATPSNQQQSQFIQQPPSTRQQQQFTPHHTPYIGGQPMNNNNPANLPQQSIPVPANGGSLGAHSILAYREFLQFAKGGQNNDTGHLSDGQETVGPLPPPPPQMLMMPSASRLSGAPFIPPSSLPHFHQPSPMQNVGKASVASTDWYASLPGQSAVVEQQSIIPSSIGHNKPAHARAAAMSEVGVVG